MTEERVIRNQLEVDEGDPFNKLLHAKSINNLKSLRIFSDVKDEVVPGENPQQKDIKIIVEEKHIDYIIKRIDRSYEKISQFILTLDRYSLKKGSPFGLKMIKEVLKMI